MACSALPARAPHVVVRSGLMEFPRLHDARRHRPGTPQTDEQQQRAPVDGVDVSECTVGGGRQPCAPFRKRTGARMAQFRLFLLLVLCVSALGFTWRHHQRHSVASKRAHHLTSLNLFSKLKEFFNPEPQPAYDAPYKIDENAWRARLESEAFYVLRQAGTERPFTSTQLLAEKRSGKFKCAGCRADLFSSTTKFESGTGWPSFNAALPDAVVERTDRAMGMSRTEVLCSNCGGHLGHVFSDGPRPTGRRHCINGVALSFSPDGPSQVDNLKNLK